MNQSPTDLDSCARAGARIFIAEFSGGSASAPPPANLLRHSVALAQALACGSSVSRTVENSPPIHRWDRKCE